MKQIPFHILIVLAFFHINSCRVENGSLNTRKYYKSYVKYLSNVINDTSYYEFPTVEIIDSSIYPILDSVILWAEGCPYFDARIKYLYAFRFTAKSENKKLLYSINAHMSYESALGVSLNRTFRKNLIGEVGIFYYKYYLFVVPIELYGDRNGLEYFSFCSKTDYKAKLRAPYLYQNGSYMSYINFMKEGEKYKIVDKEICGGRIRRS